MPLSLNEALARVQSFPARAEAFNSALRLLQRIFQQVLRVVAYLLPIYLIHQLFTWASDDPEKAFDRGVFVVEAIELGWDLVGILWNVIADLLNAAVIPLWNAVKMPPK